ncbi:MAG: HAD family hydrolase [Candidatus Bathyarchaeota archaeon]|nr:MAG: HAD family hydrolase [Candidatus Bathyarchaeota archaeon]
MEFIEVVSFDMEKTLIDSGFSDLIWEDDIPRLYGERHGLDFATAKRRVLDAYGEIGDGQPEWYDVDYWFRRFGLSGDWRELLSGRSGDVRVFPEVPGVLERISDRYRVIISSNTIREFLEVQLATLPDVFSHVFSAPSDYGTVKNDAFYGKIYNLLGVRPSAVVHVGDSWKFDYKAAVKGGVTAFHLDRSGESEGEHVVHDLQEFEVMLNRLEDKGLE